MLLLLTLKSVVLCGARIQCILMVPVEHLIVEDVITDVACCCSCNILNFMRTFQEHEEIFVHYYCQRWF